MAQSSNSSMSSLTIGTVTIQNLLILLSNIPKLIFVKLDSLNYLLWKYQIRAALNAYSLFSLIDGSLPCPYRYLKDANGRIATMENPEFHNWNQIDQALLTLINSTLSASTLSLVIGESTAQQAWNVLEK